LHTHCRAIAVALVAFEQCHCLSIAHCLWPFSAVAEPHVQAEPDIDSSTVPRRLERFAPRLLYGLPGTQALVDTRALGRRALVAPWPPPGLDRVQH
jgi:hypothetical protein